MYLHQADGVLYEHCPLKIVRPFDSAQGKLGEASRSAIRSAGLAQILRDTQNDNMVLNSYQGRMITCM